jgi:hypothetical protein
VKICSEGNIEFDFSSARTVFEHDKTTPNCDDGSTPDGNTGWPGVDFRIEDSSGWIWLEIKDWKGKMRGSYRWKMSNKAFAEEMRAKFLGTTAHLAWTNRFVSSPVRYVLLFEPPRGFDAHLLGPFQDLVRREMNVGGRLPIRTLVISLNRNDRGIAGWNDVFDDFPARKTR